MTDQNKIITENLIELLAETLETDPNVKGTRFVDWGKSFLNSLEAVTAAQASRSLAPGLPSIAAHAEHTRFYVQAYLGFMHGNTERVNWDSSWALQTVNDAEWDALRARIRSELEAMVAEYNAVQDWDDEHLGVGMNILAHTAYHLGAIRTLVRWLEVGADSARSS